MKLKSCITWILLLFLSSAATAKLPVTDSAQRLVVGDIRISGKKKTKDYIILRELTFRLGDTLSLSNLQNALSESVKNLQRQPLFHFIETGIDQQTGSGMAVVDIRVLERWYTWLWPVFNFADRNFNAWLEQGDISRLSYGIFLQQENFRGRLEKLHIRFMAGSQQHIKLTYEAPYLNSRKTLGAGLILTGVRERETAVITTNDKPEYFRHDDFLRHYSEAAAFLRYRPGIHLSHTVTAQTGIYRFSDTLLALNPEYAGIKTKKTLIPLLSYLLKADFRDQRAYPLSGWYADALLEWTGVLPSADYNYLTLRGSVRWHLPLTQRWNLAAGGAVKLSSHGTKPWFRNQGLGYQRDYVRGYEYQVVDGDNFWVTKANLRYALLPLKIIRIGRLKAEQFNTIPVSVHIGAFADAGRAWQGEPGKNNSLQDKLLLGTGLGIDFVTYYDKVVRTEFSLNREGKAGIFIHFMAAI
jgi:outer membrane protein assembly factor BamA